MRKVNVKEYNLQSRNTHLLNIFEASYYLELGNISIPILEKIFKQEEVSLASLYSYDILTTGVGRIGSNEEERDQINLFKDLRKRNSLKIVLCCGVVRYFGLHKEELYAPLVLVPFYYNEVKDSLIISDSPLANIVLMRYLKRNELLDQNIINEWRSTPVKVNSVFELDNYCKFVAELTGFKVSTENYLTQISVEYSDFINKEQFFEKNKSLNEISTLELLSQYHDLTYPVTPLNNDQKYLLLKAASGESLIIDGMFDSGKSRLALNIAFDAFRREKRVLYINHDLKALDSFYNETHKLGLANFVFDLTSTIQEQKEEVPAPMDDVFDKSKIRALTKFEEINTKRYFGYNYAYIMENLANMVCRPHLVKYQLEINLDRPEVDHVKKNLEIIQQELEYVDPFPNNIWSSLLSSKNAPTAEETISRTEILYDYSKNLTRILKQFAKNYNLKPIENVSDYTFLQEELLWIKNISPNELWLSSTFNRKANHLIKEFIDYSNDHFEAKSYYDDYIKAGYEPGDAKKYLQTLTQAHYQISDASDEDSIYLDRILADEGVIPNFISEVKAWSKRFNKAYEEIKKDFDFKVDTDANLVFLDKLRSHLNEHNISADWFDAVKSGKIRSDLNKYNSLGEALFNEEAFLTKVLNLNVSYQNLKKIAQSRRLSGTIKHYLNKSYCKQQKINIQQVVDSIEKYLVSLEKLDLISPTGKPLMDEVIWKDYIAFARLYASFDDLEKELSLTYLQLIKNNTFEQVKFKQNLEEIAATFQEFELINTKAAYFKLKIKGPNFHEIIKSVTYHLPYLERVLATKAACSQIFRSGPNVKAEYLLKLIVEDDKYLASLAFIDENEKELKKYFGNAYKEFETNGTEIVQAVEHFEIFKARFNDVEILKQIINDEKVKAKVLEYIPIFASTYEEWFSSLRDFSSSFYGGKLNIQLLTFDEIIKEVAKYINKIDQVTHVYNIENSLELLYSFKLHGLAEGIHNGIYKTDLVDNYLYSTFSKYYEEVIKPNNPAFSIAEFDKLVDEYLEEENRIAKANAAYLWQVNKNKRSIKIEIVNNYYDMLLRENKHHFVYLADTITFNNLSDPTFFDLVIIDDAHLSTSNKYSSIFNFSQVVVLGDKGFNYSIDNALMQRLDQDAVAYLSKRYVKLSATYQNQVTRHNQYIYNFNSNIECMYSMTYEKAVDFILSIHQNNQLPVNIVVDNKEAKRAIYSLLSEKRSIANNFNLGSFNIVLAPVEETAHCEINYVFSDEFLDLSELTQGILFRNYTQAPKTYLIFRGTEKKVLDFNKHPLLETLISPIPARNMVKQGLIATIQGLLKKKKLPVESGFGGIDLFVRAKTNVGIIVYGKAYDSIYASIDDYCYFVKTYQENGFKIIRFNVEEFYLDFNETLERLIKEIQEANHD